MGARKVPDDTTRLVDRGAHPSCSYGEAEARNPREKAHRLERRVGGGTANKEATDQHRHGAHDPLRPRGERDPIRVGPAHSPSMARCARTVSAEVGPDPSCRRVGGRSGTGGGSHPSVRRHLEIVGDLATWIDEVWISGQWPAAPRQLARLGAGPGEGPPPWVGELVATAEERGAIETPSRSARHAVDVDALHHV